MQKTFSGPVRLLLEILAAIVAAEAILMYALPALAPGLSEHMAAVADATLLALLISPFLLWRLRSALARRDDDVLTTANSGRLRSSVWPLTSLVIGFLVAAGSAYWTHIHVQSEAQERFSQQVDRLESDIQERFKQPLDGLRGLTGLYNATAVLNRRTFSDFWADAQFNQDFPGVRSFVFLHPLKRSDIAAFEAAERKDGAPDFTVKSKGNDPMLFVARFLATQVQGLSALGIDVYAGPERKAAIDRAVRTGAPALSSVISLAAQNGVNRPGFILLKPVFQRGTDPATPDQRLRALRGVLLASLVLEDVMAPSISIAQGLTAFELLDDPVIRTEGVQRQVVFDSDAGANAAAVFVETRDMDIFGQNLQLRARSTRAFESTVDTSRPALVGGACLLVSMFVSLILWFTTRGQEYAEALARDMTTRTAKLAKAVQLTNNSVIIANARNEIEWVNEAFSRICGVRFEYAVGKNAAELRGTDVSDPTSLQAVRASLAKGVDTRIQVLNRTPTGEEYWLDTDIQVLRDEDGSYAGYLAVETDITDVKRRAQTLHMALQETQALMDTVNAHAIVSESDGQGQITRVNDEFCRISGYTEAELIGSDHRLVNSGFHPPGFWMDLWSTISAGKPWRGEVCNRAKDGRLYWVDSMIAPFVGDDGKIEKYVSIRLDITASKLDHEALLTNAVLLEESQSVAKVGGWELDLVSQKMHWTAETFRILETTEEEFDPGTDAAIAYFLPNSQATFRQAIDNAVAVGEGFDLELEIYTFKGRRIDVRTTSRATMRNGKSVKLTGILQDITERKEYERSLKDAREKAELATLSKGQFLANMSHEIRTPMNAILGMLQLTQKTELTTRQLDYVGKAEGAARSLLGLINDILDFSKVEAGKMELDNHPFQVNSLMRDLSVILSTNVGSKPIEVLYDIGTDLPPVLWGDSMRLQQVLINLGGNAIKFTASGQVVIALRVEHSNAQSVWVEFSVKDSGIGIAPEQQAHIFTGFSQAEASTSRKYGGTGLGLAISQRLVSLMGGKFVLNSELGAGSTFSFTLEFPLGGELPQALVEPPLHSAPAQRVLIIDDNAIAAELAVRMCQSWGWTTAVAHSGQEAVDLLSARAGDTAFPFDVVYVDWQMPGMDGWQVTHWIRSTCAGRGWKQPVIVMVSANSRETLAQRTQEEQNQLSAFLVKPITASMLQEAALQSTSSEFRLRQSKRNGSSQRRLAGMRILVVEDNLINQQVAEELLVSEGALVSLAANGRLGVNAVASARPQFDVVLMDVQMPVMDGYAATRMIREELRLASLPIVAMTANAMVSDRAEGLAAGMNEHVGKPFDLGQLVHLLIKVTGRTVSELETRAEFFTLVVDAPPVVTPSIDVAGALARMGGLRSLYLRALRDFSKVLPTVRDELVTHLASDVAQATMQLHTIKGTAATLGMTQVAAQASRLEAVCKQGNATQVTTADLDSLTAAVQQALSEVEGVIAELAGEADAAMLTPLSAQSQSAGSGGDTKAASAALSTLESLLAADDMGAMEAFAHARVLLGAMAPSDMEALEQAMQSLEFAKALDLCRNLQQRWNLA
jgi:PAS domain S-box-containing protein